MGLEPGAVVPTLEAFLQCVHDKDKDRVGTWIHEASDTGQSSSLNHRIVLPDGSERSVEQQIETITDQTGKTTHLNATLQDITERQRAEDKIHQLAYFDGLTSLPNRESFKERLGQSLRLRGATSAYPPFCFWTSMILSGSMTRWDTLSAIYC